MNFAVAKARAIAEANEAAREFAANPPVSEGAARRELAYPSLVARLRIRFDETLQVRDNTAAGIVDPFADHTRLTKLVANIGDENKSFISHVVPLTCDLELPKTREAGTFNMKVLFDEFPLDPRPIAAIGVEVFVGTIPPEDFARGMSGAWSHGERPSILGHVEDDTLRFVGHADEMKTEYPKSGPATVTISGRDLRGVLLDAQFPVRRYDEIDLTQPIDEVVRDVLSLDPAWKLYRESVEIQPQEWPNNKVPSPAGDGATRVNHGPSNSKPHIPAPSEKPTYWDLITHYCTLVGAIPFFRGKHLRIRPGRSLHDDRAKGQFDPVLDLPFRDRSGQPAVRRDSAGNTFRVRKFIYGDNVGSISFTKKFGGVKVPTIRVFSLDTNSTKRGAERMVSAEWPEKGSKARGNRPSSTGPSTEGEPMVVPVPGLKSVAQALEIAKDLYEEIGRQEISGEYEAVNLSSLGGDGADPDNLRINPGDAVEFSVATTGFGSRSPLLAGITDERSSTFGEAVKAVTDAMEKGGWQADENLARVVVATARGSIAHLLNTFRVTAVTIRWDGSAKKVSISFGFDNFLEPRFRVTPSNGPVTKAPSRKSKKTKKIVEKAQGVVSRLGRLPFSNDGETPSSRYEIFNSPSPAPKKVPQ